VIAETNPQTGRLTKGCLQCEARRLANSPIAARALAGEVQDLRAEIERIWKEDYPAGRTAVWNWIERLKQSRAPK
jgi:hypothetical protein